MSFPPEGAAKISDPFVRAALHRIYGGVCFWTRQPVSLEEMQVDHVWPRSQHGPDNVYNFVPACRVVNAAKRDAVDAEALTPVLAIIRLTYGARVLSEIAAAKRRTVAETSVWWRVSDRRIRPELEYGLSEQTPALLHGVEEHRRDIAGFLRRSPLDEALAPDWSALMVGASTALGLSSAVALDEVRCAWLATVIAPRAGVQ
jgi:hypothetical protein